MKTKQFLAVAFSAIMVLFTACDKNTNEDVVINPTNIILSSNAVEVEVDATTTLAAVVTPSNATGTITWASEDAAIATVANGVITGVAVGKTTIVATIGSLSAQCEVTVVASTSATDTEALNGSNYYVITLDENSFQTIADKVVADLRPNENDAFLYIWENTYEAGNSSGPNSFGEVEPWISLSVTNVGWSGFGINVKDLAKLNLMSAISENPEEYFLHIAIKGRTATSHLFGLESSRSKAGVAIGPNAFVDGGDTFPAFANYSTDGEWNHIDIPMTEFTKNGVVYSNDNAVDFNVFYVLSGGTAGTALDIDAIFIYKK